MSEAEFEKARDEAKDVYYGNPELWPEAIPNRRIGFETGANWAKEWCNNEHEKHSADLYNKYREMLRIAMDDLEFEKFKGLKLIKSRLKHILNYTIMNTDDKTQPLYLKELLGHIACLDSEINEQDEKLRIAREALKKFANMKTSADKVQLLYMQEDVIVIATQALEKLGEE